jgi:hypothetical protein
VPRCGSAGGAASPTPMNRVCRAPIRQT